MTHPSVQLIIEEFLPNAIRTVDTHASPHILEIDKEHFLPVCTHLYQHPETYFDSLSCITSIDNGLEMNTLEVHYTLYSIPFHHHLTLKVVLDRNQPIIPSVSSVWKAANWHEREAYDLMGIHFTNHPDLRRILLPADWEGHPLRKDYKEPEFYHDIKVAY